MVYTALSVVVLIAISMIMLPLSALAAENEVQITVSPGSRANVRDSASLSSNIIGKAYRDQIFQWLGTEGDFYCILFNGRKAYLHNSVAKPVASSEQVSSRGERSIGTVSVAVSLGSRANVRDSASLSSNIIGKALRGQVYDVLSVEGDFYCILFGNSIAYLHKSVVSYNGSQTTSQPEPQPEQQPQPQPEPQPEQQPQPQPQPLPPVDFTPPKGILSGKVVFIDPGHGGTDPGTVNAGYYEKTLNLAVAMDVIKLLQQAGATVIATRTSDETVELYDRPAMVNKYVLEQEKVSAEQQLMRLEDQLKNSTAAKLSANQLKGQQDWLKYLNDQSDKIAKAISAWDAYDKVLKAINTAQNEEIEAKKQYDSQNALTQGEAEKLNLSQNDVMQSVQAFTSAIDKFLALGNTVNMASNDAKILADFKTSAVKLSSNLMSERNVAKVSAANEQIQEITDGVEKLLAKYEAKYSSGSLNIAWQMLKNASDDWNAACRALILRVASYNNAKVALRSKEQQWENAKAKLDDAKQANSYDSLKKNYEDAILRLDAQYRPGDGDVRAQLLSTQRSIAETIDSVKRGILPSLPNSGDKSAGSGDELNKKIEEIQQYIADIDKYINSLNWVISNDQGNSKRAGLFQATLSSELRQIFEIEKKYQDDMIFVSIHGNSSGTIPGTARGTQAYYTAADTVGWYYNGYNTTKRRMLAQNLLEEVPKISGLPQNRDYASAANLAVLRETNVVSALVELGFLNNDEDRALLMDPNIQQRLAVGIYKAIEKYFVK